MKKYTKKIWYCANLSYLFNDHIFSIIVLRHPNIHELTHIILAYFYYDPIEMLSNDNFILGTINYMITMVNG